MASLLPGFEYDIFISYRQKDNKYDGWVTEFVDHLKQELEATFKEDISIYFDVDPNDGLLETHNVDKSLKEKLKCLIFIPIISQTYCDSNSFAWQQEFCAFNQLAKEDRFGRDIRLAGGNVASRILPVKIHDLDQEDKALLENELGGVLRSIDFIYKSAGVNRSLRANEDHPQDNLNKTYYRDQINKVANAIKETISGLKSEPSKFVSEQNEVLSTVRKPVAPEKSIIVLPFENMSPDSDQEYFSDGLTEEIITDLSHIHNLLVISRSSAMTFKGTKKTIPEIAQAVNVRYVLEGSVRKAGNNLRITAQLIDSLTDTHIWAEKYAGTLDDVFDIQEKVAGSIASELKLKLTPEERMNIMERPFKDVRSFEYYLRAKQEINNFTENSLNKAIDYLQKAIKIEGDNSNLYGELAHAYYQIYNMGIRIEEEDLEKAREYVRKALDLDSESPDGLFVSGLLEGTGGSMLIGFSLLKKVLQLSPNHANVLGWITLLYALLGITEATNNYVKRLSQVDPFFPFMNIIPSQLNIYIGEFELAEEQARQSGSDDWSVISRLEAFLYTGKGKEAYDEFIHLSEGTRNSYVFKINILRIYASLQKQTEVNQLLDDSFISRAKKDFQSSLFFAQAFAMINSKEDALEWLENSINYGFINYPFLNEYDPCLKNIRGEERFKKLMERVKYEWEKFKV